MSIKVSEFIEEEMIPIFKDELARKPTMKEFTLKYYYEHYFERERWFVLAVSCSGDCEDIEERTTEKVKLRLYRKAQKGTHVMGKILGMYSEEFISDVILKAEEYGIKVKSKKNIEKCKYSSVRLYFSINREQLMSVNE